MLTSLLLVVVAASAAPTDAGVGRGSHPQRGCGRVDVRPLPAAPPGSARGTWTASRVVDLEIRAGVRSAKGSTRVELHVLSPGGHLYQTLTATRASAAGRSLPGVVVAPGSVVAARLPVAGTHITQRGLYGRWSVVPYLEGDLEPCGPPASFTLVP